MLGFTLNTAPRVLALSALTCGFVSATGYLTELLKESEQAETAPGILLNPSAPELNRTAPDVWHVRLDTSRGSIVIELRREWPPRGVDRFYSLVQAGYYDNRAQFGINGDPAVARAWRTQTIPDDPRRVSNTLGTVAFAFAVPNGRTTQVFINLRDNSKAHDAEPFLPIGKVTAGMDVADRLYSGYAETSGGGIRAGKQDALFRDANAYLQENFPKLDIIRKAIALLPGAER